MTRTWFAIVATDAPGMLATRLAVREAHRARLRSPAPHAVRVLVAGPTLDAQAGDMNGTLLIVEAESLAAARAFVADDPYVHAGVYAHVDIRPFRCGLIDLPSEEPR